MKDEKQELMKNIFNLMTDREKNIFYQLDDDNIYFLKEIGKFHHNIDLIVKAKGILKKELNVFDLLFNCGKYKELVLTSFLKGNEKMTHENVQNYLEYLIWIDKKGKLDEEYNLIS